MASKYTEDTPLDPKEIKFVHEYVWNEHTDGRAYKAYMYAFQQKSSKSAQSSCTALMKRPHIQKAIELEKAAMREHWQKEIEEKDQIAKTELKQVFQTLLHTTAADLYDDEGNAIPLSALGDKAQLIDGVKRKYDGEGGYDIEYSIMPKEKILDMLCKRFGLYEPEEAKVQINMPVVEVVAKIDNIETWNQNANE